jgi:hypothetical protein
MNHRPFEDWLLNEQPLDPEQKRELQAHLLDCPHCSALNEVNIELHSVKLAAPAAGFTARFRARLEARRIRERRNRLIGAVVASLGGVGFLLWLIAPYAVRFIGSPAGWIASIVSFLLAVFEMLRALGDLGSIMLRILPGFIPPIGWLMMLSAISGFILLWMVSIWRLTRYAKGV